MSTSTSFFLLFFLLLSSLYTETYALDCPSFPQQTKPNWEAEVNTVVGKIGAVKGAELKIRAKKATENLFVKMPDAGRIYLEQMMLAAYCSSIRDNKSMSETEKSNRINVYFKEVRNSTVIPAASSTACKCDVFTKLLRNKTPTIADFVVRAQGQWPISTLSSCHHLLKA